MILDEGTAPDRAVIGHNAAGVTVAIEVRLFNSMVKHAGPQGPVRRMEFPAGATVGDVIDRLGLPIADVFLVLRNGKDISPGVYAAGQIDREAGFEDGDVLAFSGPVPYSFGFGAPVV